MNKDFLLIRFLNLFEKMFRKSKIDFDTLKTILKLKLTMDDRKSVNVMVDESKAKKLQGTKASLLMQALVGLFMGIIMFTPLDLFFKVSIVFSMNFFFMIMYMMSDFSNVLLDVRDKNIIMTKPVNGETMNAARLIHITYYMFLMFAALNISSIAIGVIKHGVLFLIAYLIVMVFLSLFIIFVTTILYSMILERFNGEKLKDIINVFQIVLSVVTIISYQFMGRIFQFVDFTIQYKIKWYTYLLPPSWFAGFFKLFVEGDFSSPFVIMSLLAFLVPIILGIFLIKKIMPNFESYLSRLQVESGLFIRKNTWTARLKEKVFQLISRNNIERAFIRFTNFNLSRDRKLKLMIYPNFIMGLIFPIIMLVSLFNGGKSVGEVLLGLKGSMFFTIIYFGVVFTLTNFDFTKYSDNAEAAFIYKSFPIDNYQSIYNGAMKAYYLKYGLPTMLIMSIVFGFLCGSSAIPGIILVNVFCLFLCFVRVHFLPVDLPFSKEIGTTTEKNFTSALSVFILTGAFAAYHNVIVKHSLVLTGMTAFALILFMVISPGLMPVINKKFPRAKRKAIKETQ